MKQDFYQHLYSYLKEKEIQRLEQSLNEKSLNAVILNPQKMDKETFIKLYPEVIPHPIVTNCFIFDKDKYQLGKSIYHELGCFYIQEPSAAVVSYLLNPKEEELVLDMCAAPGGKSVQASFLMNNKGLIISNDISFKRAQTICDNAERLGLANLFIVSKDLSTYLPEFKEKFDKIILDAPCSGSGMFRKDESVKDDWSYNKVLKFQEEQKKLIINAYSYLKEGGVLSYSTCSFSKEEDEDVIQYLLDNSDAKLLPIDDNPLFYKSKDNIGVHLFPFLFPGEGHYITLIKKPGNLKNTNFKFDDKPKFINKIEGLNHYYNYGDAIFASSHHFPLKNFSIIREGIKIGELFKNNITYHYHYSHLVSCFDNIYNLNEEEIKKYISGDTINVKVNKGNVLLRFNNINVDIARSDGRMIKNHYPKHLRKKITLSD